MIKQTETKSENYLKIWLNHFCTSLLPASSSLLQSTSSLFQSTSNPLPVYFQFSSRLQPTSMSTFLCQILSFYEVWANNDGFGQYIPFRLICLKPYCLEDRKILIDIIDYPLCTVEKTKKWSNKLKQRVWTTSKFGWTTFVQVSFQFVPVYFQSTSSLFQSTSNPLPVYFQSTSSLLSVYFQSTSSFHPDSSQLPRVHFCVKYLIFYEINTNW